MIKIYGHSDDIIVIEGDINEEFYINSDNTEGDYLGFSDGTLIKVIYDGFWRFFPIKLGTAEYSKTEATDIDKNYSDIITLYDNIKWVIYGVMRKK